MDVYCLFWAGTHAVHSAGAPDAQKGDACASAQQVDREGPAPTWYAANRAASLGPKGEL
jgi:hypothetical protein